MKDILGNWEVNLDSHSLNHKDQDNIHSVQEALKEWVANTYCDQFDRISSLTKLASPWIVPMRDEFICIEKDADL